MVEFLLQEKAQVDIKDQDGLTPLAYAVSCDHLDVMRVLVRLFVII